jgi:hypothetical protein
MLTYDTMKLIAPLDEVAEIIDKTHPQYEELWSDKTSSLDSIRTKIKGCYTGINTIGIYPHRNEITVQLSAKILGGKHYKNLISRNNIEETLHNLNQIEWIDFKEQKLLDKAKILILHVTSDINTEQYSVGKIINALERNQTRRGYNTTPYSNNGVVITKNARKNTCRQTYYDKELEILREKDFICPTNYFHGKVRVELQLKAFDYIRKYTGVESRSLTGILESKKNPNWKFYSEYKEPTPSLFKKAEKYEKPYKFIKAVGCEKIITDCDFDPRKIFQLLRNLYVSDGATYNAINKEFKPTISQMLLAGDDTRNELEIVKYIESSLKQLN